MKNFKKLFASIATLALLATAVPTTVLGAASYSDELEGAYDYAYSIGITTQGTIDTANMYGSLIRSHMAKMMVNYAKEVLGQTPDTSIVCEFTDIASQSDELKGYIVEACQMGLMGVGITAFNPNGVVTRAQFGTVLSRALYGDAYNDGDPYYINHLTALKDAGIMNKIDNPNANEVRGYVMLMMQRAAGAETPAICETPENVLSCSLGLDTCPAECQAVEAKEGTLTVSSVGVDYTSIPMAGLVSFGSIKLAADTDVTVNSVKVKMQGLANLAGSYRVYFEKDGVRVTGRASFSDNIATVTFTTPLVVKSSEMLDVILELNETTAGDEIQLVSTDISSSAQTVNGSFTSASLRTADYTVMAVTGAAVTNSYSNYKVDETKLVELGEFKVTTDATMNRAVIVKALTVNNSGSQSNLSFLSDVALYRDDVKVSTKTTVGARTISFVLADEIKNTQSSANYVIKGKVTGANDVNETYNFYFRNTTDLIVAEKDTSFRTTVTKGTETMGLVTIAGGDLRFNENTTSTLTVVPGTKNVVFYDGSISSLEAIELDTLYVTGSTSVGTLDAVLQNLYVKIGSTVISVDEITAVAALKFMFDGQATVNGNNVPFMIYGDIKTDAPATNILFTTTSIDKNAFSTARYVSDDSNVTSSIGSIGGRKVTVTAADFALSNSSATSKNVQRGDRNVELAQLEFSTTSDVVSKLYSFKATVMTGVSTGWTNFDGGQVTVYDANGTALVSNTIANGTNRSQTFTLPTALTVAKGAPVKLTVKLDQVSNAVNTGGMYLKLTFDTIKAKDMINYEYVGDTVTANSTLLQSVVGGTPSIVTQSYTNKLVKYGEQVSLGNVKFKTTNADVVVKDLWFMLSGVTNMNKLSSITLYEDGVAVTTLTKTGTNLIYATNVNKELVLATNKTYEVKATLSAVNTSSDVLPVFTTRLNTGTFESTYGAAIADVLNGAISSTVKAVNEIPTITAVDGYTKGNDVVYKITLASTKEINLSSLKVSVNGTNTSGALGTLYLAPSDINYLTTNYATATVGANSGVLAGLSQGDVVIQGTKDLYVILVNGALLANTNGNASTIRIAATDMDYMDIFTDDNSANTNVGMLYNYQSAIAGTLDLLKVVSIQ